MIDGNRIDTGRAVDDERVAARRGIARIHRDAGQPCGYGRIVEVNRVAAGQGIDRQCRLVREFDRFIVIDAHLTGR